MTEIKIYRTLVKAKTKLEDKFNINYFSTFKWQGWVRPHTDKDPLKYRLAVSKCEKACMAFANGEFNILFPNEALLFDCSKEHAIFTKVSQDLVFDIYRCETL